MDEVTVGEILKKVLTFFELEAQGKCRIRVDHPLKRLAMATGLSRSQIYYRLHPKEPTNTSPKPPKEVSEFESQDPTSIT